MEILSILMVAVTVEAMTEWVKSLKKDGKDALLKSVCEIMGLWTEPDPKAK